MDGKLAELIRLVKKLPESRVAEITEKVETILEEEHNKEVPPCPHCGANPHNVVRYGKNGNTQRYRCNTCGKHFSNRTKAATESSALGESAWKQAIRDTLSGVSLDTTAANLAVSHSTAFNMRHKILSAVEAAQTIENRQLSGVCEVDDTYVLESVKGTKIPEDYHRLPRKHGAKASKRGISNEQISIIAGVSRDGGIITKTVNRATPDSEEVNTVFAGHIGHSTLVLCDGAKGMSGIDGVETCNASQTPGSFYHINNVNGYHSFIKTRQNNVYHGVATKYQNRYNALYSIAYNCDKEDAVEAIYNILCQRSGSFRKTIDELKTIGILDLGQLVNC